jgi:hypothetical protein
MPRYPFSRARSQPPRFRARLRLEGLEGRDCPSVVVLGADLPSEPSLLSPVRWTSDPPEIVNFTAQQVGNGLYVFTGQVVSENPGGLLITFGGGVPTVAGQTVETDENGNFSLTIRLRTDGTDTGTVSVIATDTQGLTSDEALVYVSPTP